MPDTSVTFDKDVVLRRGNDLFLHVTYQSRDALIGAKAYLTVLKDMMSSHKTRIQIEKIISHIADMQCGFPERQDEENS